MKLTAKKLKEMIREQLKESTAANAMKTGLSPRPGSGAAAVPLGLMAMLVVGLLGHQAYKELTLDTHEVATQVEKMSKEDIETMLKDYHPSRSEADVHSVPYDINPSDVNKPKKKQKFEVDYQAFADQVSKMSVEEIEGLMSAPIFKIKVMEYTSQLQDAPSAAQELGMQNDAGSLYKEAKKRQRVKIRRS